MIKYFEKIIKIVIFLAVAFFLKNLYVDSSAYITKVNETQSILNKINTEIATLEGAVLKSKTFYEENQKVIEATKIKEEDLVLLVDSLFKNILDKKLGFFSYSSIKNKRDSKIINVYSIKGILKLDVESLFSFEDVKEMINNNILKMVALINKANEKNIEISLVQNTKISPNEYVYEFVVLKKFDNQIN